MVLRIDPGAQPLSPTPQGLSLSLLDRSLYGAQAGLKFMILLPQSLEHWDYKCAPLLPSL